MTEAVSAVERIVETVAHLRITVGDSGAADVDWLASIQLLEDPGHLSAVVRTTAEGRGTDRDDVAMSLFVQGYAFRIASVAIGAWLLDDVVLDLDPTLTAVALGRHRPNAVRLAEARTVDAADAVAGIHDVLIDSHLARLVAAAHDACRIGEALLWGNVGAACASSFGTFMDPLRDRRADVRDRAEAFFAAARPELRRAGRLVPVGPVWAWERTSCCLWYQTDSGFQCEDCSLWSDDERRARYHAALAALET